MHALIVETGKHKGKRLKLPEGEAVLGRDEEAHVRIASEEVSRTHCLLISSPGKLVVRDLGSRNGTFVNGKPIAGDVVLQPGDLLVVGPMGFRLPAGEAEAADAKPIPTKKLNKAEKGSGLSDDEIQAWLGLGVGEVKSDADTAVMEAAPPSAAPIEPIVPQAKKVFRSVAEEAADIIRRHQELLKQG
jgi:hypothetical protein